MEHYLITHGHQHLGCNSGHNDAGFAQLDNLILPDDVTRVIVGTGQRFEEMLLRFYQRGKLSTNLPRYFSPFCGGPEAFDTPDEIILVTGTRICLEAEYIGMDNHWGFNPQGFIRSQPDNALFLTGSELMQALHVDRPAHGALYCLSRNNKIKLLQRG